MKAMGSIEKALTEYYVFLRNDFNKVAKYELNFCQRLSVTCKVVTTSILGVIQKRCTKF